MFSKFNKLWIFGALYLICSVPINQWAFAGTIDDAADLPTQQMQEKNELEDMKRELGDIKSTMKEATQGMDQLRQKVHERATADSKEYHLIAKETQVEILAIR